MLLAGLQRDFHEPDERPLGHGHRGVDGPQVHLHHLGAAPLADVPQVDRDAFGRDLHVAPLDPAIPESIPEAELRVDIAGSVSDAHPLLVEDLAFDSRVHPRVHVPQAPRPRHGESSTRLRRPHQDLGQRVSALLARVPGHEYSPGPLRPRHLDGGACVDDDHGARVRLAHRIDELGLPPGQAQVGPVESL